MKVLPLGTSSGKPTVKRNVSALAAVWESEWLLFDCGEGTQVQLLRAGLHPSRLSAIFITHFHGDHFNGLAGLLSTMGLDRREREITVIGPRGVREYLNVLRGLGILYINYPVEVREFGPESWSCGPGDVATEDQLLPVFETEKYVVRSRPLDHRIFALGYRVEERARPGRFNVERAREMGIPEGPLFGELQQGRPVKLADGRAVDPSGVVGPPRPGKILAYCTDTRPCAAAVALGMDANLLVHEATFTDEHESEAAEYGHSTASQAARIAAQAKAKRLLITHFSTRYPDVRRLLDEARRLFPQTDLAVDLGEIEV